MSQVDVNLIQDKDDKTGTKKDEDRGRFLTHVRLSQLVLVPMYSGTRLSTLLKKTLSTHTQ